MTTPKFKEHHEDRCIRLGIQGVHIYWCPILGKWDFSVGCFRAGTPDLQRAALRFCKAQDTRWTPRDKS